MARGEPDDQQRQRLLAELFGEQGAPAGFGSRLLHTSEVALLYQVSPRTVMDWARSGRIPSVRTPGGHYRYRLSDIRELLEQYLGSEGESPSAS